MGSLVGLKRLVPRAWPFAGLIGASFQEYARSQVRGQQCSVIRVHWQCWPLTCERAYSGKAVGTRVAEERFVHIKLVPIVVFFANAPG